jgi:hypothetical protein
MRWMKANFPLAIAIAHKGMDITNFTHMIIELLWVYKYQIKGGWTISLQHEAKEENLILNIHFA